MRNTLLAAAVASALALAATDASAASSASTSGAVTKAQMDAIQAQMQALADRLSKVEAANSQLQTENQQLKATVDQRNAEVDSLKAQTKDLSAQTAKSAADVEKAKGADWASRIKFSGDFRTREEYTGYQYVAGKAPTLTTPSTLSVEDAADNWRTRFRFRVGATAQVTDTVKVGFRLDSGTGDPRSSNQSFTNASSEKGIYIGQAYGDWRFLDGADLVLGKQPLMFWRPAYSLFWDNDVNPEAAAVTYHNGMFFGSAWAWMVQNNQSSNTSNVNVDPTIFGAQAGLTFPLAGGETKIAALYYQLANGQGYAPFYNSPSGNTTVKRYLNGCTPALEVAGKCSQTDVLAYGYNVFELSGQTVFNVAGLPLTLFGDWSNNSASGVKYGTAWSLGAAIGKASSPHTWEAALQYESMGKDAMFAQFIDSDFANGVSDANGWVFKAGYAPTKNVLVYATYFLNKLNNDVYAVSGNVPSGPYAGPYAVGRNLNFNDLMLDVVYKF